MSLATFVLGIGLLLTSVARVSALVVSISQAAQVQDAQGSARAAASDQKTQSQPQPCTSTSTPSSSDCKPSAKPKKKHRTSSASTKSDAGPSKTVVRNGGTGESSVAISSGEDEKQAARLKETNRLLDAADLNIKDVAVREPNASQQETIKQIRGYMDQARAAVKSGDVDRAYNLANKANMLAADLNGH
jgi:hypothetical protein